MGVTGSSNISSMNSQLDIGSFPIDDLPTELLPHIFAFLSPRQLLLVCARVCKLWHILICKDSHVWKMVCFRNGYYVPHALSCSARDLQLIAFNQPYQRNLLKNSNGQEGFKYWVLQMQGGDRFLVEDPPVGSDPLPEIAMEERTGCCFVTSYGWCEKYQLIDLEHEGATPHVMDELRPAITVAECYAGRWDCGSVYRIDVCLLDATKQTVLARYCPERLQTEGSSWSQTRYTFREYPSGVRYITFRNAGKDTQFWAGHYGAKMAGGSVHITFEDSKAHMPGIQPCSFPECTASEECEIITFCVQCKTAGYCSERCMQDHWRSGHNQRCWDVLHLM